MRILAVDDEETNLILLLTILERAGYTNLRAAGDALEVPAIFAESKPDLVLLDLHMAGMDGFTVMRHLQELTDGQRDVPVLMLTADATEETKRRALSLGARDFLTKPFDQVELLLRVRNLLQVQQAQQLLHERNTSLEDRVAERTRELMQARLEILDRLALAAEYRDDNTQEHAWRIGRTCEVLARELGLPDREAQLLRYAGPLHDIGKIGIPDRILLKPGKLTEVEFQHMQTHTTIGAAILSGSRGAVLRMAERIALSHHERWDGRGYPCGLGGEVIPLEARIVAVADVFDALSHDRPYKPAWSAEAAVAQVREDAGNHFDPVIVAAFARLDHRQLLSPVGERERFSSRRVSRARVSIPDLGRA